ncbi:TRAP transporter large permease [Afifella pfennigii]|uniref:TRAP transporter large permease n=1 Tax=Afifella pfennigii TaxID=209897 RepID=UPI00047DE359|nr:TRAP transporter large permease [Afifella pfennigii]
MAESLIGLAALLLLVFLQIPVAIAMAIVGFVGFGLLVDWGPALSMSVDIAYRSGLNYSFSVLPLFILMGNFITRAGFSEELYTASYAFLGHRRGGLAMATIVACGGFSAVSGSSIATAATMSKVAMPSMRKYKYADSLAAGSVAAGGTLGILIPPSVIMIIYGLITESDIGKLFIAGIIPGILGILGYLAAVTVMTSVWPHLGAPGERVAWPDRLRALSKVWGILLIFGLVMGGIYGGVFTPTEAAGIGASGAFILAFLRGKLTWAVLYDVLVESGKTTALVFFIVIGALIFSNFINIAGLPEALSDTVSSLNASPWLVILALMGIYLVLGCVLESLSMVLLTVPTFFPVVIGLGFDPIWFGVIVVVVTELALITPPVGLNVFVINSLLPDVRVTTIFKGVLPFVVSDILRLATLVYVPWLVLVLPSMMR